MTWDLDLDKPKLMNVCKHDGGWMLINREKKLGGSLYFKCRQCGFTRVSMPDNPVPQTDEKENLTP